MIANRNKKIALVHVAKKAAGITDEDYLSLLSGAAGIGSLAELEHEGQFLNIMEAFKNLGFTTRPRWPDTWGCTPAQRAKIEAMWRACARDKSGKALQKFIKRIAKVDSPRFLTVGLSRKVILALEQMMIKAGFDPKTGGRLERGSDDTKANEK
jgi:hypothetical protein